ncbi:MAG: hypothetical protein QM734_16475 [Cyclobacteriaceae bacterium]
MLKIRVSHAKFFVLFLIAFSIYFDVKSQTPTPMALLETAKKNTISSYLGSIGIESSVLYNGSEYLTYNPLNGEHPYLYINWKEGSINYDGQLFNNVPLLYDISIDQVITKSFTGADFQLVKPFINFFTLGDRKFINLKDSSIQSGFYEILFDSKIKVYSKHVKKFRETTSDRQVIRRF